MDWIKPMKFDWKLNYNKVFFFDFFCSGVNDLFFLGSKLTEHLQIMAIQQQKKAIAKKNEIENLISK